MNWKNLSSNIKTRIKIVSLKSAAGPMIFPFLALYLVDRIGPELAATILFFAQFIGVGFGFIGGHIADRMSLKFMICTSELFRSIGFFGMAAGIYLNNDLLLYLSLACVQIFTAISVPSTETIVLTSSTSEERRYVYSTIEWCQAIAFSVGALAGSLFYKSHFELVVVVGGILAAGAWIYSFDFEESLPTANVTKIKSNMIRVYLNALKNPGFAYTVLGILLILALDNQIGNLIHIHWSKNFPNETVTFFGKSLVVEGAALYGYVKSCNLYTIISLGLFLRPLLYKHKESTLLFAGTFFYGFGILTLLFSRSLAAVMLGTLIYTLGEILVIPISKSLATYKASDSLRTQSMALLGLTKRFAMALGSLGIALTNNLSIYGRGLLLVALAIAGFMLFYRSIKYV